VLLGMGVGTCWLCSLTVECASQVSVSLSLVSFSVVSFSSDGWLSVLSVLSASLSSEVGSNVGSKDCSWWLVGGSGVGGSGGSGGRICGRVWCDWEGFPVGRLLFLGLWRGVEVWGVGLFWVLVGG